MLALCSASSCSRGLRTNTTFEDSGKPTVSDPRMFLTQIVAKCNISHLSLRQAWAQAWASYKRKHWSTLHSRRTDEVMAQLKPLKEIIVNSTRVQGICGQSVVVLQCERMVPSNYTKCQGSSDNS